MIVDVVILIGVIAAVLLILAFLEESIALDSISMLFWIFLLGLSMNIEIPYQAATEYPFGSGIMNVTTGSQVFYEPALSGVIFGILIFNIILLIKDIFIANQSRRFGV